jgi:branched-chain amino acid transport system permease protein
VAAAGSLRPVLRRALAAIVVVALLAFPFVFAQPFPRHVMIMIFLYGALATAWNILAGYCGQISLGHAVYFGLGAYVSTLLVREAALTPWLGMVAGATVAMLAAQVIGYPVFRLRGHYFAIATIGVGEIVQTVFINWDRVGGARGLFVPIKRPDSLLNFQFHESKAVYYYIALGLLALALGTTRWLERSRRGYVFRAIREDQEAAASLGVHVAREKHVAIGLSAALTALGGTFWAQYVLFIDPESVFPLSLSILICLVAVLGGVGSLWGPLLGAAVLVPLSEGTRVLLGGTGKALDLVIYGALIVLIAVFQPAGLIGLARRFGRGGTRATRAARRRESAV